MSQIKNKDAGMTDEKIKQINEVLRNVFSAWAELKHVQTPGKTAFVSLSSHLWL